MVLRVFLLVFCFVTSLSALAGADYSKAVSRLKKLKVGEIEKRLLSADADHSKALAFFDRGEWAEASALLKRAIGKYPIHQEAWLLLGKIQFLMEQYKSALLSFSRVDEISDDGSRDYYSAVSHYRLEQFSEARDLFVQLVEDSSSPYSSSSEIYLALLDARNGKTLESEEKLQRVQARAGIDPLVRTKLARVSGQLGNVSAKKRWSLSFAIDQIENPLLSSNRENLESNTQMKLSVDTAQPLFLGESFSSSFALASSFSKSTKKRFAGTDFSSIHVSTPLEYLLSQNAILGFEPSLGKGYLDIEGKLVDIQTELSGQLYFKWDRAGLWQGWLRQSQLESTYQLGGQSFDGSGPLTSLGVSYLFRSGSHRISLQLEQRDYRAKQSSFRFTSVEPTVLYGYSFSKTWGFQWALQQQQVNYSEANPKRSDTVLVLAPSLRWLWMTGRSLELVVLQTRRDSDVAVYDFTSTDFSLRTRFFF